MSKPQVTRIGCYAVISEGDKILLCRLSDGLSHHGKWTLPGGGLDFGETLQQTLEREVLEETGLVVSTASLLLYNSRLWQFPGREMHILQFLFSVTIEGGELIHERNGSTDRVEWVELGSINEANSVDIVHDAVQLIKQPS